MEKSHLPYSIALFELSQENNKISEIQKNAKLLSETITHEYVSLISSPTILKEERMKLLEKTYKNKVSNLFLTFLKILILKNIFYYIQDILISFEDICDEFLNIYKATVYSTELLSPTDLNLISKTLSKKYGKKIKIINEIDEDLISGIKVRIKEETIDMSIKNDLEQLKLLIMKG